MKCFSGPRKVAWLFTTALLMSCGGQGFRIQVVFPQTNHLKKGSQVRYRGVPVGEVEKVVLRQSPDGKLTQAIATLVVKDKEILIREGDTFVMNTAGLIGESYIDISPGPSKSPPLKPETTVEGAVPATFPLTDLKNLSTILGLLELTTRMGELPAERRDAVMKEIHEKH